MPQIFHFPRWRLPSAGKPIVWWLDFQMELFSTRWICALPDGTVLYLLQTAAFLCHRLTACFYRRWLLTYELAGALNCHQMNWLTLSIVTRSDHSSSNQTVLELLSHFSSSDTKNFKGWGQQTLPRHKCCIRHQSGIRAVSKNNVVFLCFIRMIYNTVYNVYR